MKSKSIYVFLILTISLYEIDGQIKVATNNNVGIGTSNPLSKFSLNSDGSTARTAYIYDSNVERLSTFDLDDPIGNFAISLAGTVRMYTASKLVAGNFQAYQATENSYSSFGLRSSAGRGYNGKNYSVYGSLVGTRNGAAIVGVFDSYEPIIDGRYAGYFAGNTKTTGTIYYGSLQQSSDIRLKTNITSLASAEGNTTHLNNLSTLSAIKYNLLPDENLFPPEASDTITVPTVLDEQITSQYSKDRIGLSAQDIQKVYPEIVSEDQQGYLSVDYIGLIPILIEATKEQQILIEKLRSEVDNLKNEKVAPPY